MRRMMTSATTERPSQSALAKASASATPRIARVINRVVKAAAVASTLGFLSFFNAE